MSFIRPRKTQDVNWTYIRRSEDVLDVFWTSYVRSVYVLGLRGGAFIEFLLIPEYFSLFCFFEVLQSDFKNSQCVKIVQIWSFFWSVFSEFELNTTVWRINLRIQCKYEKSIWTFLTQVLVLDLMRDSVETSGKFYKISRDKNIIHI